MKTYPRFSSRRKTPGESRAEGAVTERMLRVVYLPVRVVVGLVTRPIARLLFTRSWRALSGRTLPPRATEQERAALEVLAAAMLEGALVAGVRAMADRAGATAFAWLTGVWPGERPHGDAPAPPRR
jgi:hypothetical protein